MLFAYHARKGNRRAAALRNNKKESFTSQSTAVVSMVAAPSPSAFTHCPVGKSAVGCHLQLVEYGALVLQLVCAGFPALFLTCFMKLLGGK